MRPSTILSLLAFIMAATALMLSTRSSAVPAATQISDAEIDRRIDAGLKRKEQQYVRDLTPKMTQIYRDMLRDYTPPDKPPETLSELFTPALRIVSGMTTQ